MKNSQWKNYRWQRNIDKKFWILDNIKILKEIKEGNSTSTKMMKNRKDKMEQFIVPHNLKKYHKGKNDKDGWLREIASASIAIC